MSINSHRLDYLDLARPLPSGPLDPCLQKKICAICLGSLSPNAAAHEKTHAFCMECITQWLQKKPSCPVCNAPWSPEDLFLNSQFFNRRFRHHLQTVRTIIGSPVQSVAMGILAGTVTSFAIPHLHYAAYLEPCLALGMVSLHPPLTSTDLHCTLLFAWLVRFGFGSMRQILPTGVLTALGILPIGMKFSQGVLYSVYPQLLLCSVLFLLESFVLAFSSLEKGRGLALIALSFGACVFMSPKATIEIVPNLRRNLESIDDVSAYALVFIGVLLSEGLAILSHTEK